MSGTGNPEIGLIQWAIALVVSLVVSLVGAALGRLWTKVTALETKVDANAGAARKDTAHGDDKLWAAIDEANKRAEDHRTQMLQTMREVPTRQDMREMETRLAESIRDARR